ncbi:hypothetical protein WISP_01271 [Willisornis vidua]|uniref:Uncharacterized protein n=1 Tax=Willisornis vidua TaxID=1566151 RepID=A0ABQ9E066_9PASS|nr:hypothetical protein WISP_01271 [Willisornis vidua]
MPQASEHRLGRARDAATAVVTAVVTAQPRPGARLPSGHRALSQERHAAPNGLSPAPKLRLLPPRPPPPAPEDPRPKKLEPERGRAAKRGDAPAPRGPGGRRGPVKGDHGVRVPGGALQVPGSASFSLPSAAERRRGNLARSKSISIGDLSQGTGGTGGTGGGSRAEDMAVALSRLVLRDCGHPLGALALRRSSSLRRVAVVPGQDVKATTGTPPALLLSVHPEGGPRSRPEPAPFGPAVPGRNEDKAAAVRASGRGAGQGVGPPGCAQGVLGMWWNPMVSPGSHPGHGDVVEPPWCPQGVILVMGMWWDPHSVPSPREMDGGTP